MKRNRKRGFIGETDINMTPMIDIVFQMIIFFVCTVELERQAMLESMQMPLSPHGPAVEKKVPGTVTIDVDENGFVYISRTRMSLGTLKAVLTRTASVNGRLVPVVIRADGRTRHEHVRRVMDTCKDIGFWRVKFAAIKDKA